MMLSRFSKKGSGVRSEGFTLLELLLVVTILGMLMGILLTALRPAFLFGQSRDARRKSDLKQIQNALQLYKNANGTFPNPGGGWNWVNSNYASPWISGLTATYVKALPTDPRNTCPASPNYELRTQPGFCYEYQYSGNVGCGDDYWLVTKLESDNSTQYSRKTVYYPSGAACYNGGLWSENEIPGLYVLTGDN